jgi:iron-sulfur cluster insertion protein
MSITVTENARRRIGEISADKPFRIKVDGGACQGFQYVLGGEEPVSDEDDTLVYGAVSVMVDRSSLPFLLGCSVDYVSTLTEEKFVISNPNAVSTCGCGTSFSV